MMNQYINHTGINPDEMPNSWTGEVELKNGIKMTIWYTAWPMMKNDIVKELLSISSDYPKHEFKNITTH